MAKEVIYKTYEEKFIKTIVLYADSSNVLYYDASNTEKVKTADLKDLFFAGVAVSKSTSFFKPVNFTSAGLVAFDSSDTVKAITFTGEA